VSREIDALVAEHVFGFRPPRAKDLRFMPMRYSADITEAWRVVERMLESPSTSGGPWMLHNMRSCKLGRWSVQFCSDFGYSQSAEADSAPMAICLAALKAHGIDPQGAA
jgi:hypothetical protein